MNKTCVVTTLLVAIALCNPLAAQSLSSSARPTSTHLVRLTIDPTGSVILFSPGGGRANIDSDFVQVSAVCTNCGGSCPPFGRTVQVVLQATDNVAAGYGVSDMMNTNYTISDITYSTQGALTPGQQVVITITGTVIACGSSFTIWFSMCSVEPANWADPCPSGGVFWFEDFENGCVSDCLASGYSGDNGAWSVVPVGYNADYPNLWYVSCAENGNDAGQCGTGCGSDESLHMGSDPIWGYGDYGALYIETGFNFTDTSSRAQSPTINCTGRSNITVRFNYIEWGWLEEDHAQLWYYNGSSWALLNALAKTPLGSCAPQGTWTAFSTTLPASANNNPNVRIGFLWENVDPGGGAEDPSFAVDDIALSTP